MSLGGSKIGAGGGGGASLSSGQKAVEKLRVGPERSHHQ